MPPTFENKIFGSEFYKKNDNLSLLATKLIIIMYMRKKEFMIEITQFSINN